MANSIVGAIVSIGAPVTLSSKSGVSFTKRDLVLAVQKFDPNTGEPYSDRENTPVFTFMGDKWRELDHFHTGQLVRVAFDLTGRRYQDAAGNTRYINDVRGYKVEEYSRYCTQDVQPSPQPVSQGAAVTSLVQEQGDVPF